MSSGRNLSLITSLLLAACGGGGGDGGGGGGGPPPPPPPPPPPAIEPTLASIQDNVFTPICTTCHAGAAAPNGLRLEEGMSHAMLVNVPSLEVPALLRVEPGNPDDSYLIQKIEGTAAVGGRMPLGGDALPPDTIAAIRQWITDGARCERCGNSQRGPAPAARALAGSGHSTRRRAAGGRTAGGSGPGTRREPACSGHCHPPGERRGRQLRRRQRSRRSRTGSS